MPTDCANLHIRSVWCLFSNPLTCDKLQQTMLAPFLKHKLVINSHLLIVFAESWIQSKKMSDTIVIVIFVIYAAAIQVLFRLPSLFVPLHNSPLGELGPWGPVCPLAAETSANILEFSSPGEHWPLPGRRTETRQSSMYLICSTTNIKRFKKKYSHTQKRDEQSNTNT